MAYQPRIDDNGRECCTRVLADGRKAYGLRDAGGTLTVCDKCRAHHQQRAVTHFRITEDIMTNDLDDYAPPDPFERDLTPLRAALRAASVTPASIFEEGFKRTRERDLAAEDQQIATLRAAHAAHEEALTNLSEYEPPNSYERDIKTLQAVRR